MCISSFFHLSFIEIKFGQIEFFRTSMVSYEAIKGSSRKIVLPQVDPVFPKGLMPLDIERWYYHEVFSKKMRYISHFLRV